jgi:F0F1-type ATP synthase delta subunit
MAPEPRTKQSFVLPVTLVGPADVNRTLVELEQLDEAMRQIEARPVAGKHLNPKLSRTVEDVMVANRADMLAPADRSYIIDCLRTLQGKAPVLHISFSAEPSSVFTAKIVEWLRANISKYVLVQVGLQPTIAAGCIVRGTSKVFDLSLRRHLHQNRPLLAEAIRNVQRTAAPASPESGGAL